jgi:hypothetical protein
MTLSGGFSLAAMFGASTSTTRKAEALAERVEQFVRRRSSTPPTPRPPPPDPREGETVDEEPES